MNEYYPDRGDFIWLDFNPQKGREQAKKRPALVVSPKIYNKKSSLAFVCPITSKYKGWPFEVLLPRDLKVQGSILSDQLKSLDYRARNAQFIDICPFDVVEEVLAKIATLVS